MTLHYKSSLLTQDSAHSSNLSLLPFPQILKAKSLKGENSHINPFESYSGIYNVHCIREGKEGEI